MIHSSKKIISRRFGRLMLVLNIPSITAAVILIFISFAVIKNNQIPEKIYSYYLFAAYAAAAYSFIVTLAVSIFADRCIKGHEKYTYIEITGPQMILSEYTGTANIDGELVDYRRIYLIDLAKVNEVKCTRSRMIVNSDVRRIEQRADWLDYTIDDYGKVDFDFWWFNSGGGEKRQSADIRDNYVFAERIAQRIIFCSEREKAAVIRREEFRRKMLEIAEQTRKAKEAKRKKKPAERVFRGYEIKRHF